MSMEFSEELTDEYFDYITDPDIKDGLHHFIDAASDSSVFSCHFRRKGVIRDLRFYTSLKKQPFALIINKASLLFYIRKPAVSSGLHSYSEIQENFTEVNENNSGEWTIKVKDADEALKIIDTVLAKWVS